jgi:alanine racemase
MYHNNYVEINLDNINKNVNTLIKRYNNYQYYFGSLKADAYGHGMIKIAQEIIKQGINYLVVSSLDEALELRKKLKYVSILCDQPISLKYIKIAIKNNITIVIDSYDYFLELIKMKFPSELKVHLEINTGINCFGINNEKEIEEIIPKLLEHKKIFLEGLFTKLTDTNTIISSFFDEQINKLLFLIKDIKTEDIPIIYVYDDEALLSHPKLKMTNGIILEKCIYGINPIKYKEIDIKLLPTFKVYSEIISKKIIKSGENIGYDNNFKAKTNMRMGIVPFGYKNGLSPLNSGRNVTINNSRHKIIDNIYMNYAIIYIDDNVNIGDKVTLIGDLIPIEEISEYTNISESELMIMIDSKIPKKYIKNGKNL